VIAKNLTQAVVSKDAVPLVDQVNRDIYSYNDLSKITERAKFYPFWPLEDDGSHVTFDQVHEEYRRFLQA
jgi:hypothetical protein